MPNRIENLRSILWRTAASGALIYSTAACGPAPAPSRSASELGRPSPTESQQVKDAGKELIINSINELPSSTIKDNLQKNIPPLLQITSPTNIDIAGVSIPLHSVKVVIEQNPRRGVFGFFAPRADTSAPLVNLRNDTQIELPYIIPITSEETTRFPKAPDGSPIMRIGFRAGTDFSPGISPRITIRTSETPLMSPQERREFDQYKKFMSVKEALTLQLYLEQLRKELTLMQKFGYPTHAEVTQGGQAEFVSTGDQVFTQNEGRLMAAVDLAGYGLALKAWEGSAVANSLMFDKRFKDAIESLKEVNFGNTSEEFFTNAVNWAINSPAARQLEHSGSLDRLP